MSKNILLLVTGMSPAIVTETLYGLAVRPEAGQQPWIPDAVHVIRALLHKADCSLLTV